MAKRPEASLRAPWPSSVSRPVVNPLQPSVVYASGDPDELDAQYEGGAKGFTYAREGHPNAEVLAGLLDEMEGGNGGIVTSSGMGAITIALLALAKAGEHVLGADQLYGRSLRLMNEVLPNLGIATSLADPTDLEAFEAALRPETSLILIETVSNPTLRVADVKGIIALAKARGIRVAVDNTFPTPRGFSPLQVGADVVIHSVTKLLAGHSDATLGYVSAKDPALTDQMNVLAVTMGFTPSPFDCWLAERGLYTFDLRYERSTSNAALLADALASMDGVQRVLYPARQDHPDHNRSVSMLNGEGGHMVSFEIGGGRSATNAFVRAAQGLNFAPTLGDIATTISHPPTSSHRALTPEGRAAIGISEGFFRISVGCEEIGSLINSFEAAAKAASEA